MKIATRATAATPRASHLFIRTAADYICGTDAHEFEGLEFSRDDGGPGETGHFEGVMEVMNREQTVAEQLAAQEEISQLVARVPGTGEAKASLLERRRVVGVGRVGDVDATSPHQRGPGPRQARRPDAVEEVHANRNCIEQLGLAANPHQVARLVGGELTRDHPDEVPAQLARLAQAQAADGMAREPQPLDDPRALAPKLRVEAALDDAEKLAPAAAPGGNASLGPSVGALRGGFGAG